MHTRRKVTSVMVIYEDGKVEVYGDNDYNHMRHQVWEQFDSERTVDGHHNKDRKMRDMHEICFSSNDRPIPREPTE